MAKRKHWGEITFQRLSLEALSIEALNQVLAIRAEYDRKFQEYQARLAQNQAEKKSLRAAISSATQQMDDVGWQITHVWAELAPFRVGIIGKWLYSQPTIRVGGSHFRPEAQPILARWTMLCERRNELYGLPLTLGQKLNDVDYKHEFQPKKEAKLRYQSQTLVFDISAVNPERLNRIIEKKKSKSALGQEREGRKHERAQAKLGQTKAKAAAYENKQRELAKSIRTALRKELKDNPYCPYCNKELSTKGAHADHIHPVVKGGLSTIRNMVFVCGYCNIAKGTLTLRAFLSKMNFVEADIYERLEHRRKDV